MSDVLDKAICLSLNKNWLPLGYKTVRQAITDLCGGAYGASAPSLAVAVTIDENGELVESLPMKWEEWVKLPVRDCDLAIQAKSGPIRAPLIIVSQNYSKMPLKSPRLTNKAILERDGFRCAYTGEKLAKGQLSVDHVVPKYRGGKDAWENMVACRKDLNTRKGHALNHEIGLKLLIKPKAPLPMPVSATIGGARRPEHVPFVT